MLRVARSLCLLACVALTTGCWDRVEIEDRGFVVGSAIDSGENGKLALTFQYVVPSVMLGKSPTNSKSGQSFLNVTTEGNTLFRAAREMSNQSSRSPYLEHNKIIILSDSLARQGRIGEVLDLFIRDHEMRRAAKVMIAVGEAKKLLEVKPAIERLPVLYIDSTAENPTKSDSLTPATNIGRLHEYLLEKHSYALPQIRSLNKNKISVSGAAVFDGHSNRMVGFLNKEQTRGRNFFKGTIESGTMEILINKRYVVLEVKSASHKFKANIEDKEHPVFDVWVKVEGNVSESFTEVDLLDPAVISEIESKAAASVSSAMEEALEKVQKEYRTDILGFGEHLEENHYAVWSAIKDNWDRGNNYFSRCQIRIHVRVKMRIIGSITKTQNN